MQWSTFLDFVNPEILTKKFQGINGRKTYEEKWAEIVTTLNSMGYQNKPVAKWQKAVADWRSKVKGKAASIKRGLSQTGRGGPSCVLNENELRLLAIIGTIAVIGVTEVERGIVSKKRQIHIFFVPLDPFHSSFVTDSYTKYLTSFIVGPRRNTDNFFK
ncbi:uncharacterized protein LOC123682706 isoform X2 [Harmonia axyridis]|uniref:uncharacterized protein LOC123682706 isoform X2 n=1 Tax=Harmonia axyridis TaxID=115357 RepID=UPI001E278F27|nr:uncharacterized protein LOC123682706 isoform X2 [Harmonia axyridis]